MARRIAPDLSSPQVAALRRLTLRHQLLRYGVLAIEPSALQAIVLDCTTHEHDDVEVLAQLGARVLA
jgi:hypothetical protein